MVGGELPEGSSKLRAARSCICQRGVQVPGMVRRRLDFQRTSTGLAGAATALTGALSRRLRPLAAATLVLGLNVARATSVTANDASYSWRTDGTEEGVRVAISEVERHNYDVIKGTVTLPFAVRPLLDVLQAFERYTRWYYNAAEVRVLSAPRTVPEIAVDADGALSHVPASGPWILLFRQHTPPLSDRWTILRCHFDKGPGGSVRATFHSQPPHIGAGHKPAGDAVYMQLHGYWELRPLGPARTLVTFVIDADPDTSVPTFLVDPELRAIVVKTLAGLKRQALALGPKPTASAAHSGESRAH